MQHQMILNLERTQPSRVPKVHLTTSRWRVIMHKHMDWIKSTHPSFPHQSPFDTFLLAQPSLSCSTNKVAVYIKGKSSSSPLFLFFLLIEASHTSIFTPVFHGMPMCNDKAQSLRTHLMHALQFPRLYYCRPRPRSQTAPTFLDGSPSSKEQQSKTKSRHNVCCKLSHSECCEF